MTTPNLHITTTSSVVDPPQISAQSTPSLASAGFNETSDSVPTQLSDAIRSHPLFKAAEDNAAFVDEVIQSLSLRLSKPGDCIVQQGDTGRAMFFIVHGCVLVKSADDEMVWAELGRGSFFGEIGLLFDRPRTASVVAKTRTLLAVLQQSTMEEILRHHPAIEKIMKEEALQRLNQLQLAKQSNNLQPTATHEVIPIRRRSVDLPPSNLAQDGTHPTKSATASLIREFGSKRRASVAVWSDDTLMQKAREAALSVERSMSWEHSNLSDIESITDSETESLTSHDADRLDSIKSDHTIFQVPVLGPIPEPLALRCFTFLESDPSSLGRLEQTCKTIQDLLRKGENPLLWSTLDLSARKKTLTDAILKDVLEKTNGTVKKLIVNGCWSLTDTIIKLLPDLCPDLQALDLTGVWEVTDEGLNSLVECKKLEILLLDNCRKISDASIQTLVTNLSLKHLSVSYDKNLTGGVFEFPSSWTTMETFAMQRCTGIFDDGFGKWINAGQPFAFKTLVLSDCSFLTDSSIATISYSCPNLEVFLLNFCCGLTPKAVEAIAQNLGNMKTLDLSFDGTAATVESIRDVCQRLVNLEKLGLRGCAQITDDVVQDLIQVPRLNSINISQTKLKFTQPLIERGIRLLTTQPLHT